MNEPSLPLIGLLVALGCGILVGLERERRKGEGDDRAAAGIRTFTVAAVSGAMAQGLGHPGLVVVGALLVLVLVGVAYHKSRSRDPGLTTELALFATYLIGVQAMRRARREPELVGVLAAGALFSSAATWIQVMVITAALSGSAARLLAPLATAGLACALAAGIGLLVRAGRHSPASAAEGDTRGPLRLREALIVATLLSVVTLVAAAARQQFGVGGVYATAALAGLADAHSRVASAVALFAAGSLSQRELVWCVLLALSANSAMRVFVAFTAGGARYGARVAPGLLLALAAAAVAAATLA